MADVLTIKNETDSVIFMDDSYGEIIVMLKGLGKKGRCYDKLSKKDVIELITFLQKWVHQ